MDTLYQVRMTAVEQWLVSTLVYTNSNTHRTLKAHKSH